MVTKYHSCLHSHFGKFSIIFYNNDYQRQDRPQKASISHDVAILASEPDAMLRKLPRTSFYLFPWTFGLAYSANLCLLSLARCSSQLRPFKKLVFNIHFYTRLLKTVFANRKEISRSTLPKVTWQWLFTLFR